MAIPKIEELYNPILGFLSEYNQETLVSIRKVMKEYFYLSSEEAFRRGDDKQTYTLFEGRVNTACIKLHDVGLLHRPKDGTYAISDMGREIADIYEDVDNALLRQIKNYQEHIQNKQKSSADINTPQKGIQDNDVDIRNFVPVKEYKNIPEVTIETTIELEKQDARFANMIVLGIYMLEDGQIREVPQEVLQQKMSLTEYKKVNPSYSTSEPAIAVKANVGNPGKMKSVTRREPIPGGLGKRPRQWINPDPFDNFYDNDKVKKAAIEVYDRSEKYNDIKSFMEAMKMLIQCDYNISFAELGRRTGIKEDTIEKMCGHRSYSPKFLDLMAIFLKLRVPITVCEKIFSLAGYSVDTDKYKAYKNILELLAYHSAPEINDLCIKKNIEPIFPATITD